MEDMQIYFNYLEELRESGVCNMLGAGKYLERGFGVSAKEAKKILLAWIKQKQEAQT